MSITFDTIQQAIVDSEVKYISWLFDITHYTGGTINYFWSTKTKTFKDKDKDWTNDYSFKVIPDSFSGITLNRAKSELGVQSPNEVTFQVVNPDNTLTGSDFVDGTVHIRLIGSKYSLTELLTNSGLETHTGSQDDGIEDAFTGYVISGTNGTVDSTATVRSGTSGVSGIKITAGAAVDKKISQTITVTASEHYTWSFWFKSGASSVYGRYRVYDVSNGADIVAITNTSLWDATSYDNYQKINFTTPVGCTSVRLDLYCPGTNGQWVFYDDLSLTYAEMQLRMWPLVITRCESVYQTLTFTCEDILQKYIKGDYPKKGLVKNLFKANNNLTQDNYCLPESFGTAYIPLRIVLSAVSKTIVGQGFEAYAGGAQDDGLANTFSFWTVAGTDGVADASATVHGGSNACKLIAGATMDKNIKTLPYAAVPNTVMQWAFWTRGDGTYAGRYRIYDNTHGTWITALTSTGVVGTSYTQVIVNFVVPQECIQTRLYLYCPALDTAYAYFDDVTYKQLQEFYLLGPTVNTAGAAVTYTVNAQRVPRAQLKSKEEYRSGITFTQSTIVDDSSTNRRVFINNVDNTAVTDWTANVTFGSNDGEHFYDVPTEFTRSDRTSTNPEDTILAIFNDLRGANYGILNLTALATAGTTYDSWGLDWNGGLWGTEPTEKIIGKLANMSHSTLVSNDFYGDWKVLSKTSQKTITKAEVIRTSDVGTGTFRYTSLSKDVYNSGYVAYQVLTEAQDELIQILVPMSVGGSTSTPSSEILELPFINDDVEAQKLGILYFQRKYGKIADISFSAKATCLALQPDDVITINHVDYGGNYAVLIESITVKKDLTLDFKCIRFDHALSDWEDLSSVTAISAIPPLKQLERNLSSMDQMFMEKFQL